MRDRFLAKACVPERGSRWTFKKAIPKSGEFGYTASSLGVRDFELFLKGSVEIKHVVEIFEAVRA